MCCLLVRTIGGGHGRPCVSGLVLAISDGRGGAEGGCCRDEEEDGLEHCGVLDVCGLVLGVLDRRRGLWIESQRVAMGSYICEVGSGWPLASFSWWVVDHRRSNGIIINRLLSSRMIICGAALHTMGPWTYTQIEHRRFLRRY